MFKQIARKVFFGLSKKAVLAAKNEDPALARLWDLSLKIIPGLEDHFIGVKLTEEAVLRARHLICAETYFVKSLVEKKYEKHIPWSYLDIGDSDGSVRLLLMESLKGYNYKSSGINLQQKAVERMREKGLNAEHIDAMELGKAGRIYNIVSVFETLEHLPDPVGFLMNIHQAVGERLIISVPFVHKSRVSLRYLDNDWPLDKVPTIENIHVFELSPDGWERIFKHSGWAIERQWKLLQFPSKGILKNIMGYAWRKISFEGYWFVSLRKDDTFKRKFKVE